MAIQQFIVATLASLGAGVLGTILAWSSPIIPMLESANSTSPVHSTPNENTWVASLIAIGAMMGAVPGGIVSNLVGRKKAMIGFGLPAIGCWGMMLAATTATMLCVARFIQGVVIGGVMASVIPTYIGEIASSSIRGTLGSMFQLFVTLGILFVYVIGAFESYYLLNICCLVLNVCFLLGTLIIPESPVYLIGKGNMEGGTDVLKRLNSADFDAQGAASEIQKKLEASLSQKFSIRMLFTKANIKALVGGLGLMVFQQLSGINAVIFFSSIIFKDAGSTLSPNICSIIIGIVQCVATVISVLVVDRLGRKPLLIASGAIMGLCLGILGYTFYLKEHNEKTYGWLPLACVFFFIVMFSFGFGPIPWTMIGELFSPEIKDFASGIAVAVNWILAFVVTKFFRDMTLSLGSSVTFWIFGFICVIGIFFVLLVLPETKGKTLAQIQEELGG